jgi:single-stranded DNA-binding protein
LGKTAEIIEKYVTKGKEVAIETHIAAMMIKMVKRFITGS